MNTEILITIITGVATIIGSILAGVSYIVKNAHKNGVNQNKFDVIEAKVKELPCEQHNLNLQTSTERHKAVVDLLDNKINKDQFTNLATKVDDACKRTEHADCKNHTTDIIDIKRWIMKLDNGMIDSLSKKYSPRKLNPVGIEVLKISGANKILEQIRDILISQLEERKLSTAFDVETESYFTVLRNDRHESYKTLKNFVYNQPEKITVEAEGQTTEVKIDYDAILRAVSLNLRDEYLQKHPEIE